MHSPESLYQVWYELTSTIEDGIVILNTSDIICHLNKGISQLFPIASEDFRGTKFNEFIEEVVLPVIRNPKIASSEIFHLTSSNRTSQDIQIVSGPGKGHSVEFSIREGDNPDFPWKMGYFRKITRWKKTEEILVRTEERFRTIFENLFDSVTMYQVDETGYPGRFIETNTSSVKRLGYNQQELLTLSPADIIPPEVFGRFLSFIKNFKVKMVQTAEFSEVSKNGEIIPVEITALKVNIQDEEFIIQISRDISDRVKIRQLQKNAYEQINRNIEQFAILNDRIRNPLSVILTLASFTETPENVRISEQVHIIDSLVDELDKGFIESEKVRKYLVKYFQADT